MENTLLPHNRFGREWNERGMSDSDDDKPLGTWCEDAPAGASPGMMLSRAASSGSLSARGFPPGLNCAERGAEDDTKPGRKGGVPGRPAAVSSCGLCAAREHGPLVGSPRGQ